MQITVGLAIFLAAIFSIVYSTPREKGIFAVLAAQPGMASVMALAITALLMGGVILTVSGVAEVVLPAAAG